jgi:hypothetical protein
MDLDSMVVVGAKTSVSVKLEADKSWTKLDTFIKQQLLRYVKDNNLMKEISTARVITDWDRSVSSVCRVVEELSLDVTKPAGKFMAKVKAIRDKVSDKDRLEKFARALGMYGETVEVKKMDLGKEWKEVMDAYPLLKEVDNWYAKERKKEIQEYINALDLVKF